MAILSTENLSKSFAGVKALNGLSIDFQRDAIHGLIGPNGSGKTTFFNVVTGLLPASGGKIFFNGEDCTNLPPFTINRMGISRTFQLAKSMANMTCVENVMAGRHSRSGGDLMGTFFRLPFTRSRQEIDIKTKAMALLDFVGLSDSADRWASELVWVELQRLQIARALASEPKLLLLDEPTAGMGEAETESLQHIIRRIQKKGTTVVLIDHDVDLVARLSDRVTVIDFGEKIAEGSPEDIRNDPRVVEAYLGSK